MCAKRWDLIIINVNAIDSVAGDASPWVRRFAGLIPSGEVLDLACGGGRHARLIAALGHPVLALDRDACALADVLAQAWGGQGICTMQLDLENPPGAAPWPFAAERFAGIVITNYLHRPLFPAILNSLAQQGVLIVETFAQGNARFGKPSNPDFLLNPGELIDLLRAPLAPPTQAMHVLAYEDGYIDVPKPAMVQRICAMKGRLAAMEQPLRLI